MKTTNYTEMNHVMVYFRAIATLFLLIVSCNHKNGQFCGILIIPFHISLFSPLCIKLLFKLKMRKITTLSQVTRWNIQNPTLKKNILCPFIKTVP